MPVGECDPSSERLREQFEGVVWRFRTGSLWRDMPADHDAWTTAYHRVLQWRDLMCLRLPDGRCDRQGRSARTGRPQPAQRGLHCGPGPPCVDAEVLTTLEKAVEEKRHARRGRTVAGAEPVGPTRAAAAARCLSSSPRASAPTALGSPPPWPASRSSAP
ncbi:transposase [Streptomyces sp. NPDC093149]|uniref:transposase n=1 Tax=Streptomyces sp. NPDC093149 TaxID=3366031 RepID=UPI00380668A3